MSFFRGAFVLAFCAALGQGFRARFKRSHDAATAEKVSDPLYKHLGPPPERPTGWTGLYYLAETMSHKMGVEFDAGPLHFGGGKSGLDKRFKLSFKGYGLNMGAGVNATDGFQAELNAALEGTLTTEGATLQELISNTRTGLLRGDWGARAGDAVAETSNLVARDVLQAAESIMRQHYDPNFVFPTSSVKYVAAVTVSASIGYKLSVWLGLLDPQDYRMFGAEVSVSAIAEGKWGLRVGVREAGKSYRLVLALPHVRFDIITIPL